MKNDINPEDLHDVIRAAVAEAVAAEREAGARLIELRARDTGVSLAEAQRLLELAVATRKRGGATLEDRARGILSQFHRDCICEHEVALIVAALAGARDA